MNIIHVQAESIDWVTKMIDLINRLWYTESELTNCVILSHKYWMFWMFIIVSPFLNTEFCATFIVSIWSVVISDFCNFFEIKKFFSFSRYHWSEMGEGGEKERDRKRDIDRDINEINSFKLSHYFSCLKGLDEKKDIFWHFLLQTKNTKTPSWVVEKCFALNWMWNKQVSINCQKYRHV